MSKVDQYYRWYVMPYQFFNHNRLTYLSKNKSLNLGAKHSIMVLLIMLPNLVGFKTWW